jgi:hypothetical protein
MKLSTFALFILCFFATSVALGQNLSAAASGTGLTGPTQGLVFQSHTEHASQKPLAQEQSLLENSTVTWAQGERPLSDFFTSQNEEPLGDVARRFRKEQAAAKNGVSVQAK